MEKEIFIGLVARVKVSTTSTILLRSLAAIR
jgi:hypothetical protein